MKKTELLEILQLPDAFTDFQSNPNSKLWGWNGKSKIFGQLITDIKPKLILEVGSWMGESASTMAKCLKDQGLDDSVLVCIDTWLGSKEHWRDPELVKFLEIKNGRPTFYSNFLSNMINAGISDLIIPLSMPSQIAASYLKDFPSIKADMLYLDGSHDEKDVYEDLNAYWDLISPGGCIVGDDWPWETIKSAVKAFCAQVGVPYQVNGINWIIRKPL